MERAEAILFLHVDVLPAAAVSALEFAIEQLAVMALGVKECSARRLHELRVVLLFLRELRQQPVELFLLTELALGVERLLQVLARSLVIDLPEDFHAETVGFAPISVVFELPRLLPHPIRVRGNGHAAQHPQKQQDFHAS